MNDTTPPAPGPQPRGDALDRLFDWLRALGIRRDTDSRWVSGVSSGLAARLGVDPIVVRAGFVLLAFFGGFGVTAYLVLWLVLPSLSGDILLERALRHGQGWPIVLLIVAASSMFGGPFFAHNDRWWAAGWVVPAAVVAWVVYRLARKEPLVPTGISRPSTPPTEGYGAVGEPTTYTASDRLGESGTPYPAGPGSSYAAPSGSGSAYSPAYGPGTGPAYGTTGSAYGTVTGPAPAPRPGRPRRRGPGAGVTLLGLGLGLVGFGLGYLGRGVLGVGGDAVTFGLITALATIGLFLVVLGLVGRSGGFTGFVALVLLVVTAAAAFVPGVRFSDGIGDRVWVAAPRATDQSFRLGIGDSTLDLSALPTDPATPVSITVEQGVGDLTVQVPTGLTVEITSRVGAGDISLDGRRIASRPPSSHDDHRSGPVTTVIGDGPVAVHVSTRLGLGSTYLKQVTP